MSRSRTRRVNTWVAAGGLLAPATLVGAAMTAHAALPADCTADSGGEVTCTYSVDSTHHAGASFDFAVPTGVTTMHLEASGGSGGGGSPAARAALTTPPRGGG